MKRRLLLLWLSLIVIAPAMAASKQAISQLNAALRGEFNAAHRYEAYAKQADTEGDKQVARLFRAAARAERIHRDAIKAAVRALGAEPADLRQAAERPGSTKDNLAAAVRSETVEVTYVYPRLLKRLKLDNDTSEAVRIIEFALAAESQHAKLFQDALDNLGKNKEATYFICPVCSLISDNAAEKLCPACQKERTPVEAQ